MGQRRVQLGMNVVATALPAGGAEGAVPEGTPPQPEDVVLYFGIIDILQARAQAFFRPSLTRGHNWRCPWDSRGWSCGTFCYCQCRCMV